jgi:hypothetical protein
MRLWKNVIVIVGGAAAGYVLSGFATLTYDLRPGSPEIVGWRAENSARSLEADGSSTAESGSFIPLDLGHALLEAEESGSLLERLRSEHGDFSYLILRRLFDQDPTLGFLSNIREPATSQAIATQLLGIVGDDDEAVRKILSALPTAEPLSLRIAAFEHAAARDPVRALERLSAEKDGVLRREAAARVARIWADSDPGRALSDGVRGVAPDLRDGFISAVHERWALNAPHDFLRYILGADSKAQALAADAVDAVRLVASIEPEMVLSARQQLHSRLERLATVTAAYALAERDREAALAFLNSLETTTEIFREAHSTIALALAERDPEYAMSWAQSQLSLVPESVGMVLGVVAQKDLRRALDLAVAGYTAAGKPVGFDPLYWFGPQAFPGSDTMAELSDRLSMADRAASNLFLPHVIGVWANDDPMSALDWVIAHEQFAEIASPQIALRLAASDPAGALEQAGRLPVGSQRGWVNVIVRASGGSKISSREPERIAEFLEAHKGSDHYGLVLETVAWMLDAQARPDADDFAEKLPRELQVELQKLRSEAVQR